MCFGRRQLILAPAGALFSLLLLGSSVHASESLVLRNVSSEAGLANLALHDGAWFGVAVVFADLDGDFWPDLYFGAGTGQHDQVCINLRKGQFRCTDAGPARASAALAV